MIEAGALPPALDDFLEPAQTMCLRQCRQRAADMAKLEAAHTASQSQSEEQTQELQDRLHRAQEAVKQLETRRALDQEGWASDVTLLRRLLAAVDRYS